MRKIVLALTASLAMSAMPEGMAQPDPLIQHLSLTEHVPYDTIDGPSCSFELDMDYFIEGASDRVRASMLKFDIERVRDLQSARSGGSETARMDMKTERLPEAAPVLNLGLVNKMVIEKAFGEEYAKEPVFLAAALYRDAVVADYRKAVKEILDEYPDSKSVEYSYRIEGDVIDTGNVFVTYRLQKSCYTGGAHPMHELSYLNFDGNGFLTLEKLFGADRLKVLEKLVFKALLAKEGVKDAEGLKEKSYFPDQFTVSEDFYVQGDTMVFVYDPYEIAAYSRGTVELAVPLKDLKRKGLWK